MSITKKQIFIYLLIATLIFLLDRVTKIYILNYFENASQKEIFINFFLNIILVWNTGIGFGLLSFEETSTYNFITILIIIINLFIAYIILKSDKLTGYFLTFVLGGSLGNLFDRLYYSAVPDFIDLNYNGFHWFIFNIADIFISIGIMCLIFAELLKYKKD